MSGFYASAGLVAHVRFLCFSRSSCPCPVSMLQQVYWRGRRISLPKPCWIQTPFLASIQRRSCAQVNESKQLLGRTRPPLPQFQWWLLQFQTSKLRCQQHWNWGPGLRNTGTSKLHSHRPLLRHQDATLDRVLKEGLKTLRLRIVKPRWNFGGTAAFCPYQ